MFFKGKSNEKNLKENRKNTTNELEKQALRINALEVKMKKLIQFEKECRIAKYSQKEPLGSGYRNVTSRKTQNGPHEKGQGNDSDGIMTELTGRVNKLEQSVREINSQVNDRKLEREGLDVRKLSGAIDQIISEKLAVHLQREKEMQEKIRGLERQIAFLMKGDKQATLAMFSSGTTDTVRSSGGAANKPEFEELQTNRAEKTEELHQTSTDFGVSQLNMRISTLEYNYALINSVQAELLKRVEILMERLNGLMEKEDAGIGGETQNDAVKETVYRNLYIDKLYLDKYEQNNNFAQLGIKQLSGTLNIGATYGLSAIPKEINEHVKEEINKLKAEKEKMQDKASADPDPDTNTKTDIDSDKGTDKDQDAKTDTWLDDPGSDEMAQPTADESSEDAPFTNIPIEGDEE